MDLTCLTRQEFDSDVFGLDFYRVTRLDPEILGRELSLLPVPFMADAKTPAQDIDGTKSLMRLGFRKVCTQPTYRLDLSNVSKAASGEPSEATEISADELAAHAANFPYSRFGLDPDVADHERLSHQKRWLTNTMASAGIFKFVEPGAFVSFKLRDNAAVIDLISVLPRARGRGSLLLGRLRAWAASKGLARIEVTTESENITACLFYQKNGYHLDRVAAAFHMRKGTSQ